ncbi:aldo/keto reductases [Candidatus Termititenax aidoneus]|uniref:Aldo/keto reductases n=1 Tax=Termititenax aidoneus TaxID=2218524 RepID=A0A388TCU4_TERA1|nr:aldo/keto reductases [Candidatus Termititenax aidoneus]
MKKLYRTNTKNSGRFFALGLGLLLVFLLIFGTAGAYLQQKQKENKMETTSINPLKAQTAHVPTLKLNNGLAMPQFGLGTYLASKEDGKQACLVAFRSGYRHVDTAHAYQNEAGVGEAVRESGIPREELWITSKLWPSEYGEGKTLEAIDRMLERLQMDYIDLLYVHQPVGDFVGAWKDMEKAVAAGKVHALGISNFDANDEVFSAIVDNMKIKPAVLQMECHPYAQRLEMREKVKPYNIAVECWFPLGGAMSQGALFKDPVIRKIAEAHSKTPAQIILRWHIQEGFSVIPGAINPDYIKENIEIFDFALNDAEMAAMRSLNKEQRFFNATPEQLENYVRWKLED